MGNSASQERPADAHAERHGIDDTSSTFSSDTHDHGDQQEPRTQHPKAIKSIMEAPSFDSLDSQPTAQHYESSADHSKSFYGGSGYDDDDDDSEALRNLKITEPSDEGDKGKSPEGKPVSKMMSGEEIDFKYGATSEKTVPTLISWVHGGRKVYVTGTFTGWRKMIKLTRAGDEFSVVLNLLPGTHRIRFVVDNELRCSDMLPTATDSMGNLVNYIEVFPEDDMPALEREGVIEDDKYEDDVGEVPPLEYTSEIPEIFTNPEVTDKYVSDEYPAPPFLPPHLETVILNNNWTEKDDSSVLPIPNHVVLNHLATTSIKHNVLAVASVSRYARKYVTQILYAPL
ncbi:5'-AMP-activated protein kinase beta subunit, interation domain-containing protein [Dipodascopsis tothii]|uniref:5'-AMP-activated protein kinase beta subunit, interation domain-containing protein n=1 Tax=Dipodascopsis tothii TaxID=44089 RepID=UPI0034CF1F63